MRLERYAGQGDEVKGGARSSRARESARPMRLRLELPKQVDRRAVVELEDLGQVDTTDAPGTVDLEVATARPARARLPAERPVGTRWALIRKLKPRL